MISFENSILRRKLIAPVTLSVFFCLLLSFSACGKKEAPTAPKAKVAVIEVIKKDVPIFLELVGQTVGSLDIAIRARVEGQLEGLHFQEGMPVTKGQLLYEIDPNPFEQKVNGAKSVLAEAETQLAKAEADLARVAPLAKMNAVSQRDLDAATAARDAAMASVEAAKAGVEYASIERGYTKIESPIDGLIGITKAKVGDFVGREPNPVVLNMVSQVDPIHVKVTLSEGEYLQIARRYATAGADDEESFKEKQAARRKNPLYLILSDGTQHTATGTLHAVNSQVDPTTGTITIEASFPNPKKYLRPGQYAKVKAVNDVQKDAILVWQRAVQELQSISQVYVVDKDGKVSVRQVTPGLKTEGLWIIEKGLKAGERVIVEGLQRVKPGMIVEALSPEEMNVTPPESLILSDKAQEADKEQETTKK